MEQTKEIKRVKKVNFDKVLGIINNVMLVILGIVMLYPIFYIFLASVSDYLEFQTAISNREFIFYTRGFTFNNFKEHFITQDYNIYLAYANTFLYTIVGTAVSLFLSITCAYVLSRKGLKVIKFMTVIVVLTMWLKPGMVATYENIKNLGLLGTRSGIILPFAFSAFNVILLRTYFAGIPNDIDESAQIDGANHFRLLWSIYIPASVPAITTVGLFYAIDRWNGYFWAEVVLGDEEKYPLQVIVKSLLTSYNESGGHFQNGIVSAYALIIIALLPVIVAFPFIQKYFKKGVMVGSVK